MRGVTDIIHAALTHAGNLGLVTSGRSTRELVSMVLFISELCVRSETLILGLSIQVHTYFGGIPSKCKVSLITQSASVSAT